MSVRIGIAAAIAAMFAVSGADAHPQLKAAGPAPGSVVTASPKALRIQFNETIEIKFSGIEVTNEKGEKQPVGTATNAPNDKAQMIVPVTGELKPGKYTVAWHAVGDDTHHVDGKYNFEVKP
jgi:methionine-rich copper-binding protein CopC